MSMSAAIRSKYLDYRADDRIAASVPVTVYAHDGRHQCFACDVSEQGVRLLSAQEWPSLSVLALSYRDPDSGQERVALGEVRHRQLLSVTRTREGHPFVTLGVEFLDSGEPELAC